MAADWVNNSTLSRLHSNWLEPDDDDEGDDEYHPPNCQCPDCDDMRYHEGREE